MSDTDKKFAGSIPKLYDEYLVPLIFEYYASDLADRVAARSPRTVLETAAGSGVVTRALAPKLSAESRYTVTDLNPPMLEVANERQGPDDRITWKPANALELPFDDADFDAVLCQFGVMFFPDRVAGYAEARRVLREDGRFVFNVWDSLEQNEIAELANRAVAEVFPDDPPQFLARTPYAYNDLDLIRSEIESAGFSDAAIETVGTVSSAPSAEEAAIAFCQGTPLRMEIEERDASLLAVATERAEAAIAERFGAGPVSAKMQAHVIVASA